eukprot:gene15074-biopygen17148
MAFTPARRGAHTTAIEGAPVEKLAMQGAGGKLERFTRVTEGRHGKRPSGPEGTPVGAEGTSTAAEGTKKINSAPVPPPRHQLTYLQSPLEPSTRTVGGCAA